MRDDPRTIRGRGAADNPPNRFERLRYERDPDEFDPEDDPAPTTEFLKDSSRTILATNDSPDVGFDASINPYRGCEHGCVYCYARPTHQYLGFSAGLDFESKILVKENAPELLRRELMSPSWQPKTIAISGVTDPYQPVERKLRITRGCLEVLAEFRNPVGIITKNKLVTRDIDVLSELARFQAVAVFVSITTLDAELVRALEPRTTQPMGRLTAVAELAKAEIPVGVMVAPIIPGLNDHEVPAILSAAARAGARVAKYTLVRLPLAVAPLFEQWLDRHAPDRKEKVLGRIRAMRGGKLNDSRFGARMHGSGRVAEMIDQIFKTSCQREGIGSHQIKLSTDAFRRTSERQLALFD
jgi:DNA repair photolyase